MSDSNAKFYEPPESLVGFLTSDKFINLVVGPVGSTKTTAGIIKISYEAKRIKACKDGIRRSRAVWIRNTAEQLRDTSIPDFLQWYPDGVAGVHEKTNKRFILRFDDVECEVLFRGLDDANDVRRLLSLQATFAIADEFRELNPTVFEAMQARLGRYPSKAMNGVGCQDDHGKQIDKFWGMTNPPDAETFWEKYLSDPPANAAVFFQPSALSPEADWLHYLKDGYYENLVEGKSDDWVDVYVHAKFGRSLSGQPVFRSFDREMHVAKGTLNPNRGSKHPLIVGMDFGLCYDDKTEVLTKHGWKFFKDVDEHTDEVATLNPDGFALEYTPINFKVDREYDGEMIEFATHNMNFCVTPEHRTPNSCRENPTTLRFDSAEELAQKTTSHRYIQLAAKWTGSPMNLFGIPDDLMAPLLGWYISEGSITQIGNSYRVSITQKKPAPQLAELLTDTRWPWTWHPHGETTGFRASVPKDLGVYLKTLGKSHSKYIPQEVKEAPPEVIKLFLYAYVAGDGHIRSRTKIGSGVGRKAVGEITASTVSCVLKDDLQEVALKAGWASGARVQKGRPAYMKDGRKIDSPDVWIVTFKRLDRAEILSAHSIPYKGRIYCLNVPYHTLYVRRNGKPCWNGNTPAATINQIDPFGRFVTFADLVSDGMGALRFTREKLKPLLATRFAGCDVLIVGDPAGNQRAQTDERTVFEILRSEGFRVIPAKTNSLAARITAVDSWLTRTADGKPAHIIDPCCTHLIAAMRGGYKYKVKKDGEVNDSPEKNGHSHVMDAHEYACMHADPGVIGGSWKTPARPVQVVQYRY